MCLFSTGSYSLVSYFCINVILLYSIAQKCWRFVTSQRMLAWRWRSTYVTGHTYIVTHIGRPAACPQRLSVMEHFTCTQANCSQCGWSAHVNAVGSWGWKCLYRCAMVSRVRCALVFVALPVESDFKGYFSRASWSRFRWVLSLGPLTLETTHYSEIKQEFKGQTIFGGYI